MTIRLALCAVAATALTITPASADEPVGGCGFDTVQQATLTGDHYTGVAYGYAIHAEATPLTLACYLKVNDVPQRAAVSATGLGAVVAAGTVTFAATETDLVELCTEITTSHGTTTSCDPSSPLDPAVP